MSLSFATFSPVVNPYLCGELDQEVQRLIYADDFGYWLLIYFLFHCLKGFTKTCGRDILDSTLLDGSNPHYCSGRELLGLNQ